MSRGFGSTFGTGTSGDYILTAAGTSANPISHSIWLYARSAAGRTWVDVFSGSAFDTCGFIGGAFEYLRQFSTTRGTWSMANPSTGRWHHLAITYDGSSVANVPNFYLDGVAQTVTTNVAPVGTLTTTTNPFYIGNTPAQAGQWDGMLAHVAFWRGLLLSQAEVSALAGGINPLLIRPDSLALYLPLDGVNNPEPDLINGVSTVTGTRLGTSDPPVMPLSSMRALLDYPVNSAPVIPPFLAGIKMGSNVTRNWR